MKDVKRLLCALLAVLAACQGGCREIGGAGQQQNVQDVSSMIEAATQAVSVSAQPTEVQQPAARQQKTSDSVSARRLGAGVQVGPESAAEASSTEKLELPVVTTSKFKKIGRLNVSSAAAASM